MGRVRPPPRPVFCCAGRVLLLPQTKIERFAREPEEHKWGGCWPTPPPASGHGPRPPPAARPPAARPPPPAPPPAPRPPRPAPPPPAPPPTGSRPPGAAEDMAPRGGGGGRGPGANGPGQASLNLPRGEGGLVLWVMGLWGYGCLGRHLPPPLSGVGFGSWCRPTKFPLKTTNFWAPSAFGAAGCAFALPTLDRTPSPVGVESALPPA